MKDERYKELRKENDGIVQILSTSYKRLAEIYVKKARGYAVRNSDTELKINDVLKKLEEYDNKSLQLNIAIPNETLFIEENISLLAKEYKDPDRWKTVIWLTVIGLLFLGWFVVSIWMRQEKPNYTPTNLKYEVISTDQIKISWDKGEFATEGYYVWMIDETGKKYGNYEISENSYIFTIDLDKTYTFYVKTRATEFFGESAEASIKYQK